MSPQKFDALELPNASGGITKFTSGPTRADSFADIVDRVHPADALKASETAAADLRDRLRDAADVANRAEKECAALRTQLDGMREEADRFFKRCCELADELQPLRDERDRLARRVDELELQLRRAHIEPKDGKGFAPPQMMRVRGPWSR